MLSFVFISEAYKVSWIPPNPGQCTSSAVLRKVWLTFKSTFQFRIRLEAQCLHTYIIIIWRRSSSKRTSYYAHLTHFTKATAYITISHICSWNHGLLNANGCTNKWLELIDDDYVDVFSYHDSASIHPNCLLSVRKRN